jgi:hypothetical protein
MEKSPASVPVIATPLMATAAVVVLLKVADCDALLEPTAVLANVTLDGLTVIVPDVPVPSPLNATVCGLLLAASVNASVAVRVPVAVGLNTTVAPQLEEAPTLVPHVLLVMEKSPELVPVIATLLIATAAVVVLLKVAVCDVLLEPTAVLENVKLAGFTLTPAPTPLPVSVMVCGLSLAESVNASVALRAPAAVG